MIDAKQIPPEVVEAADAALRNYEDYDHTGAIRAAIAAAFNAWPGASTQPAQNSYSSARTAPIVTVHYTALILPLTTEKNDAEA